MNESSISVRYAKALFQSAKENGLMEKVFDDMQLLLAVCRDSSFTRMIETPVLNSSRKCEVLDHMFEERITPLTKSLLDLVVRNRRDAYLQGIARYYRELYKKEKGIRSAELVTAQPIDKEAEEKFRKIIATAFSSEIEMTSTVREDLIGGFLLTVEDQQYDASVARNLKKIKKHLLQSTQEKK